MARNENENQHHRGTTNVEPFDSSGLKKVERSVNNVPPGFLLPPSNRDLYMLQLRKIVVGCQDDAEICYTDDPTISAQRFAWILSATWELERAADEFIMRRSRSPSSASPLLLLSPILPYGFGVG